MLTVGDRFPEFELHDAVRTAATIHAAAVALEMEDDVTSEVPALAVASRS